MVLSNCFYFVIPIQKNNLTLLFRLAVLSVLSQACALLAYFFEGYYCQFRIFNLSKPICTLEPNFIKPPFSKEML